MALDRQSIQRKDFPLVRRGYDPAAVDAHLAAVADELAAQDANAGRGDTLASSASDHVRTIVEAAETSAAKIRRDAETKADATRNDAEQHARRLSASSAALLERLEATRRELESVIESLRSGASDFDGELGPADRAPAEVGHNGAGAAAEAADEVAEAPVPVPEAAPAPPAPAPAAPEPAAPAPAAPEPAAPKAAPAPEAGDGADESEAARLVALNMALNRTPRDETAKYLSEHFRLSDRDRLLDEVYASVEG